MNIYLKADEEPWIFIGYARFIDLRHESLPNMPLNDFLRYRERLQPACYIDLKDTNFNALYELAERSKQTYRFKLLAISEKDERTGALFTFDTLRGWQNVFNDYTISFKPLAQTSDINEVVKQIEN